MSGGYGPPIVNTFGMIAGLGKTFDDAYDAGVKARQEREAPEILSKLLAAQSGAATAPSTGTLGTIAQSYQNGGAKPPSFASSGGAAGDYLRTVSGIESGGDDAAKKPRRAQPPRPCPTPGRHCFPGAARTSTSPWRACTTAATRSTT